MRGCLAAAVLLVSAAAAPACRRTAAEMVAALDLRPLSHSPCASAVIPVSYTHLTLPTKA